MAETIPGGYYIGANGQPHDANGKPLSPLPIPKPVLPPVTTETVALVPEAEPVIEETLPPVVESEPASAKPKRTPKAK